MMLRTLKSFSCLLFIVYCLLYLVFPSPVFAACKETDFSCLETIFTNVLHFAIAGAAIASFVMILMGGFSWLSSGGDPKHLEQARDKITYGIAGLVIMILAWFILSFIYQFTGVDVTKFEIPAGSGGGGTTQTVPAGGYIRPNIPGVTNAPITIPPQLQQYIPLIQQYCPTCTINPDGSITAPSQYHSIIRQYCPQCIIK